MLTIDKITQSYGVKTLFTDISFTIDQEKIGLIGVNGTGKSTLLKIIAGHEVPGSGSIIRSSNMKIEYLPQNPDFDPESTVIAHILKGNSPLMNTIRDYEICLERSCEHPADIRLHNELLSLTSKMDALDAWDVESRIKTVLTKLGISEYEKKMKEFSGGQQKRISLAGSLISPCDLLILDEPTNHLDNNMIDWLETYLKNMKAAVIMVTHDRYFLDRVADKIVELSCGSLHAYPGNYSYYLDKKLERLAQESATERKKLGLYKKELAWIRKGAKARTTKQKARIQRFDSLKDSIQSVDNSVIEITSAHSRLGNKIIELNNLTKSYGDITVIDNFSYSVQRDDRIGIIGPNGAGKSTLLNLITKKINPDHGEVNIGETVKIAYLSQDTGHIDPNLRSIEYIKETAEYVTSADGIKISASQMMENFLFPSEHQYSKISTLSGGELRRLYLLKVLMNSPNVLILDEPTNDLDIDTLKVLESYIDGFSGPVITVSHDRYFLDRICNKILVFDGGGKISLHTGNYFNYIENMLSLHRLNDSNSNLVDRANKTKSSSSRTEREKKKLSYKEQREFDSLENDILQLETALDSIDALIKQNQTDFVKLQELSEKKEDLENKLLNKLEREEHYRQLIKDFESK
ncbi:MAG TPA: ABC transporter [Eubacteriaceae bacterium]|jgi:ATP-binding cassette subfamily F protein uup|nr:ABC transporter [Eubacteriaceae bacterium]